MVELYELYHEEMKRQAGRVIVTRLQKAVEQLQASQKTPDDKKSETK
jgi:hypothetical protein